LADENPTVRGTAAWAAGTNGCREAVDDLKRLADDRAEMSWYENDKVVRKTVADLAEGALAALGD
jgi:HEAT repeat protein